ncbi:MAG: manganese efflux pump MntP family protein [Bacteroidetes bacterium]|nr:manganese efflux pump MntP family protein [Bacteroidota bacterium]MBU1717611.1 manganese efflux pump MntP family protein [Bacteroidota bacterium]
MDNLAICLILAGLLMDVFSAALGIYTLAKQRIAISIGLSLAFAVFLFGFSLGGYYTGQSLSQYFGAWAFYVLFFIGLMLGLKIISATRKKNVPKRVFQISSVRDGLIVSFAGGINAFALFIPLGMILETPWETSGIFAVSAIPVALCGFAAGKKKLEQTIQMVGLMAGILLIGSTLVVLFRVLNA